ncbi:hypothetical protein [Fluviicola taffensis]|uniref:Uncharacterized protein n=1 Tax=Fluviicola taffensis (strain DSM 16823 / NCIMB 13979 / RW262) TaxID=755732 RepID=F2IBY3_FLUTR|nr:hypothetical protein [Fluviicola taffensis]AEA42211.1 hypothetical protein Fluta_0202 [Fluviicola taffensis DSM 16823]
MSAAENKLNLVQMIVESEDKTFVSKVLEYARSLKKEKKTDWAEELPEHVLEELRLAIEEADNGTDVGIPHEVMLKKFRKQYPHLNL